MKVCSKFGINQEQIMDKLQFKIHKLSLLILTCDIYAI